MKHPHPPRLPQPFFRPKAMAFLKVLTVWGCFFFISCGGGGAHIAQAKITRTVVVKPILLLGDEVGIADAEAMMDVAAYMMREISIQIEWDTLEVSLPGIAPLSTFAPETYGDILGALDNWLPERNHSKIYLFLAPKLEGKFLAGVARRNSYLGTSSRTAIALAYVGVTSSTNGKDRIYSSGKLIAHELAHTLGAAHVDEPERNIMHPDACGRFSPLRDENPDETIHFEEITKQQVTNLLQSRQPWFVKRLAKKHCKGGKNRRCTRRQRSRVRALIKRGRI